MESLITDIGAETAELWSLIAELPEGQAGWDAPTPAAGWAVRDQISHLAFFDDAAVRSATDPEGFTAEVLPMLADGRISPDTIAERYRPMPTAELLSWFDGEAEEVTPLPAQVSPLPQLPATASIAPLPFALPDRHQILEGVQRLFIPARPLLLSPSA